MDHIRTLEHLPGLSGDSKRAIRLARYGKLITTGHILMGILKLDLPIVSAVFTGTKVTADSVRELLRIAMIADPDETPADAYVAVTVSTLTLYAGASDFILALGATPAPPIEPLELIMQMAYAWNNPRNEGDDGVAYDILKSLGITSADDLLDRAYRARDVVSQ